MERDVATVPALRLTDANSSAAVTAWRRGFEAACADGRLPGPKPVHPIARYTGLPYGHDAVPHQWCRASARSFGSVLSLAHAM